MPNYEPSLDRLFAALGDPTRRAILSHLASGPASVGDIAAPHDMALPSFLGHLKKLEASGLVTTAKKGRVRYCALAPSAFEPAVDWLDEQRTLWEGRLDRLDDYVMTIAKERSDEP